MRLRAMTLGFPLFAALAAIPGGAQTSSPPTPAQVFGYFEGDWSCEGYFIRSKKPLASDFSFRFDADTGQLNKRHIDRAPNRFKAYEIWAVLSNNRGLRATIADPSGLRWYKTTGWDGDRLAWERVGEGEPVEQFVYTRKNATTMVFEWWIARDGAPIAMGDTLTCTRAAG